MATSCINLNTITDINHIWSKITAESSLKVVLRGGKPKKGGMNVDDVTLKLCNLSTDTSKTSIKNVDIDKIINDYIVSKPEEQKTLNDFYVLVALAIAAKRFQANVNLPEIYHGHKKITSTVGFPEDENKINTLAIPVESPLNSEKIKQVLQNRNDVTCFKYDDMILLIDPLNKPDRYVELVIVDENGQRSYEGKAEVLEILKRIPRSEDSEDDEVIKLFLGLVDTIDGGGKVKKTNMKKIIAGRTRLIYKIGQKQYVKIKGSFVSLKDARCIK